MIEELLVEFIELSDLIFKFLEGKELFELIDLLGEILTEFLFFEEIDLKDLSLFKELVVELWILETDELIEWLSPLLFFLSL